MPKRCCFYAFHFSAGAQLYPTVLKYFPAGKALSDGYFRRWLHLYQCFCKILLSGRRLLHFRPYFLCYVAVCPGAGYAAENPHTLHYGSGWNRLNHCSKQDFRRLPFPYWRLFCHTAYRLRHLGDIQDNVYCRKLRKPAWNRNPSITHNNKTVWK